MGVDLGAELSRHRVRLGPIGLVAAACAVAAVCLAALHPIVALLVLVPLGLLGRELATRGGRDVPEPPVANEEGIGALLGIHPAEPRPGSLWAGWVIAGALLFFALFLLYATIDVPDRDASGIVFAAACAAAGLGGVGGIAFLAFGDRHDELRLHEHGFAYRRRGVVRSCRWDEIVDYRRSRHGAVTSVRRADGTWIALSSDVPAVERFVKPGAVRRPDHSPPPGL